MSWKDLKKIIYVGKTVDCEVEYSIAKIKIKMA
jgi:hypothetical protein